ncbi:MAG TPA: hypothetical protein ENN17_05205 [bacterium]|nr:hypothetical protein [bacterium]
MNLEDLKRQINQVMHEHNYQGIPDFEGYSPSEMHQILHFTFDAKSPVQLQTLSDSDYQLYKETDSLTVHLSRILLELSGFTKKRNGKLSLTKSGEKTVFDQEKCLKTIFKTFTTHFNWAYNDGYGDNEIGQLGYGFSLILLSKYGKEKQLDSFYAEKYFKAYPQLLESMKKKDGILEDSHSKSCYSIRTFDRFLDYFGLIRIDKEGKGFDWVKYITKTDLFDRWIQCTPPATLNRNFGGEYHSRRRP